MRYAALTMQKEDSDHQLANLMLVDGWKWFPKTHFPMDINHGRCLYLQELADKGDLVDFSGKTPAKKYYLRCNLCERCNGLRKMIMFSPT